MKCALQVAAATLFSVVFSLAMADSIRIVPKSEAVAAHCLSESTSGYVANFDGASFEIYTALVSCDDNDRIPPRCNRLLRPKSEAPPEVQAIMAGKEYELVRNVVSADDIVGIRFDQTMLPLCKAGKLEREKKSGPIMQPASLQPVSKEELKLLSVYEAMPQERKVLGGDWMSYIKNKRSLGKGDVFFFDKGTVPEDYVKSQDTYYLAGKKTSTSIAEQYVMLEGKFADVAASGMQFEVQKVIQLNTSSKSVGKIPPISSSGAVGLKPLKVNNKGSTEGGYNWQGETSTLATLRLRIVTIRSASDRTINIESDSKVTSPMHLKSVHRAN